MMSCPAKAMAEALMVPVAEVKAVFEESIFVYKIESGILVFDFGSRYPSFAYLPAFMYSEFSIFFSFLAYLLIFVFSISGK